MVGMRHQPGEELLPSRGSNTNIGAHGAENGVQHAGSSHSVGEGAVIVQMVQAVHTSIQHGYISEKIVTGMFVQAAQRAEWQHADAMQGREKISFGKHNERGEIGEDNLE